MRIRLFVLSIFLVFLQGCANFSKFTGGNAPRNMMGAPLLNQTVHAQLGAYRLSTSDRIRIVVFGQDALSNAYQVDSTGHISMPLIGRLHVQGKTTKETEEMIATKLKDGFVREPHLAIEVETYRPFFIMGEVAQSGQFPYVYGMTAQTAIAIGGGFTPRANRDTAEVTRTFNGQLMRAEVPMSFLLLPGDTIQVKERWF